MSDRGDSREAAATGTPMETDTDAGVSGDRSPRRSTRAPVPVSGSGDGVYFECV